jgi:hypothetical protein
MQNRTFGPVWHPLIGSSFHMVGLQQPSPITLPSFLHHDYRNGSSEWPFALQDLGSGGPLLISNVSGYNLVVVSGALVGAGKSVPAVGVGMSYRGIGWSVLPQHPSRDPWHGQICCEQNPKPWPQSRCWFSTLQERASQLCPANRSPTVDMARIVSTPYLSLEIEKTQTLHGSNYGMPNSVVGGHGRARHDHSCAHRYKKCPWEKYCPR